MSITLAEAVAQLEDYSANEVAALLLLAGKSGDRGDEHSCPMANYFLDVLGTDCVVSNTITWLYGDRDVEVDLPGGVKQFISEFDSGSYPELENPDENDDEDNDDD